MIVGRKNGREEGRTTHLWISLSFLLELWSSSSRSFIWIKKVANKIRVKSIKWWPPTLILSGNWFEVTKLSRNIKEGLRASTQWTCTGLSRLFYLIARTSQVWICPFSTMLMETSWSASYDYGGSSPPTFCTWAKSQNLPQLGSWDLLLDL